MTESATDGSGRKLVVDRPGSAGTLHFYHNMYVAQVSWVNLADSDRSSSDREAGRVDHDFSDVSLLHNSDQSEYLEGNKEKEAPDRYPEYAYVRDKKTGKRIFYKRVDEYDVLLESVQAASNRVGVALLVASNLVIFALGYIFY